VTSSAAVRWCHYKGYGNLSRLSNLILLGMLGGVIVATHFLFYYLPGGFFYSAVITASFILGSKVAVRMTALESQYESSLQLFLVLLTWFNSGEASKSSLSSALSSILVIGKSGAESFLTFGHDNRLEESGTLQRLKLLAIYSPVFTLTAIFRIMALAAILAFIDWHSTIFIFLPLVVGPPLLLLLFLKFTFSWALQDLSVTEIVESVGAELTTHSLWGGRVRENTKNMQLAMAVHLLFLYTLFLVVPRLNCSSQRYP